MYSFRFSAGGSGGPRVERYIPPPIPTSEDDIFGEVVAKGENFDKYHRATVKCTPEGKSFSVIAFSFHKNEKLRFSKAKFSQSNSMKKQILQHKFSRISVVLISKSQHLFNDIQFLVFNNKTILLHVHRLVLAKQ